MPAAYLHQFEKAASLRKAASSEGINDGRLQDADVVSAMSDMEAERSLLTPRRRLRGREPRDRDAEGRAGDVV